MDPYCERGKLIETEVNNVTPAAVENYQFLVTSQCPYNGWKMSYLVEWLHRVVDGCSMSTK